jgi:tetratricopeptide (TPR) repeat protein
MRHAKPRLRRKLSNARWIVLLPTLLLGVPFLEIKNHAEDTVAVVTNWRRVEAHPIYLVAAPSQDKLPPRPLNLPIVSARKTPTNESIPADQGLPLPMSAAQEVRIGNGLIEDSDFQLALKYFEDARKQDPNSIEVMSGLARCYYELGRDDESFALYKDAIARDPSSWPAQYYLGRIHLENGRYTQAVEVFDNAIKLRPDDTETISSLGVALSKSGRGAEAIPYLTRITALKRYIKEDHYYLGEAYANNQQWLKAAQAFKDGADLRGTDPNGYFYWATMLFNADKLDEAFDAYLKVKTVDFAASHSGTARYMAEIYRLRGMPSQALGQYQLLLRREPNDVEALFQAGYLSFKLNQLDLAKDYFKKVMEIDPKHAGAAADFAALEARYDEIHNGRNEKTIGITLREVVQANPSSVEAHVNLGAQLIAEAVYPEALGVLERAVSLRPNSAAVQYDLGLAQIKNEKYEAAVTSIRKALELKPNWPDAYNNLGLAYAGLSRWDEAVTAYHEALRLIPEYSGALFNLAIAHLRLGQKATAIQLAEEKLRPLNSNMTGRVWQEIFAIERSAKGVVASVPSPTPVPSPDKAPVTSAPVAESSSENKASPSPNSASGEDCLGPIYRPSDVTQIASLEKPLQVPYTDEAVQNKVEGKIVLQVVLCGNGAASDITIEGALPFGLTERAIESIRKVRFKPALLDSRPVSIIMKQTFACAGQVCTTISP